MYDKNLRRAFINTPVIHNSTVKHIREALECLPDDMEVLCCGANEVWLHIDEENNICSFDYDNLSDCEDYKEEEYDFTSK